MLVVFADAHSKWLTFESFCHYLNGDNWEVKSDSCNSRPTRENYFG